MLVGPVILKSIISRKVYNKLLPYSVESDFWAPLNRIACQPATRQNRAKLLINGLITFEEIFKTIDEAEKYVSIQFYIIHHDELGKRLARHLQSAKARGVDIYFIYDEIGSKKLSYTYIKSLRDHGIHCMPFNSNQQNKYQLNFRNHRKIVVIDGSRGFVGGHNVSDEYLGIAAHLPHWRDTHIMLEGPCVLHLQLTFLTDWYWITQRIPNFNWEPVHSSKPIDNSFVHRIDCLPLASGPSDLMDTCALQFLHLIHTATHRLWIVSPYFVPDQSTVLALELAALRGVDVRVLIPFKSDNTLVTLASWTFVQDLMPSGVRFYQYKRGMLHQKVMLVDHQYCCIGTANFDNRSFRINFEISAILDSAQFSSNVADMLNNDFEQSEELRAIQLKKSPLYWALARTIRLLSPLL